jgi:uncharacterized phiE125 gp8 family phage protein
MTAIDDTLALVTLEEVKQFLDVRSSDNDNWIQQLINRVGEDVNGYTGRTLRSTEYADAQFDGKGADSLVLPQYPVTALSNLTASITGSVLTEGRDEDYVVDYAAGVVYLVGANFSEERFGAQLTYTAGYTLATVPEDLKQAALEAIMFRYQEMDKKRVGVTSHEMRDQRSYFTTDQYPAHVLAVWERYRSRRSG